ncbi:MAG: hypothetical protein OXC10_12330 [Rhodospirillaceae bacterium]|nr:hypothetical protein [Rhodospirillaceae bacterium]
MRLDRLGAFHQTRLSFLRAMLRHVSAAGFRFGYDRWEIGDDGVGTAVYAARGPDRTYSLVCFAHDLDPSMRTDRVIAEAWDATYVLYDGTPDDGEIERLRANTPKQEAGRFRHTDLILSRTNKSARLFDHVVECLASGRQPDAARLDDVGYVMRTTAVYGNGKFGIADRQRYAGRAGFGGPFRMEMLTVWMIRQFVADLVDHMARVGGGDTAVPLDPALRRRLGIGNSTGLGLGPFVVNHPALFARWIECRELALARVCAQPVATEESWAAYRQWIERAREAVAGWVVPDPMQAERIARLATDLDRLAAYSDNLARDDSLPWAKINGWAAQSLSLEGQELVVSLLIEPHGDLVDDLADRMAIDDAEMALAGVPGTAGDVLGRIEDRFGWALEPDYQTRDAQARFWYVSANKLEPRLGERWEEPGAALELPLATGRDIAACHADLRNGPTDRSLADFLLRHPEHRHAVRRLYDPDLGRYGQIRDNLIGADLLPLNLLRCKLAFFGATHFDPKSDRWLRINMFCHAPFPDELDTQPPDDWIYPQPAP